MDIYRYVNLNMNFKSVSESQISHLYDNAVKLPTLLVKNTTQTVPKKPKIG